MKPIIGILPTSSYLETDDSFKDTYRYANNYIKKIIENGGIPYLIPLNNNEIIEETLSNIDGLLLPGGHKILDAHLQIVDYCYKNKIPMLGICMGMQILAMYSVNKDYKEHQRIVKKIDNHWPIEINRTNEDTLVHNVNINKDSILFKILNNEQIKVNSLHNYTITKIGKDFKISCLSDDNIIEGIEYTKDDNFIIGVQFHPEVLPKVDNIFKTFIINCQLRGVKGEQTI